MCYLIGLSACTSKSLITEGSHIRLSMPQPVVILRLYYESKCVTSAVPPLYSEEVALRSAQVYVSGGT